MCAMDNDHCSYCIEFTLLIPYFVSVFTEEVIMMNDGILYC